MHKLLLLFLLLLSVGSSAQELYQVRIGTFQDVRSDDFQDLRELGFVYGQPLEGQLTDVYIGNYTSAAKADQITAELTSRGFRNAAPFPLPAADSTTADYIQIALRGQGRMLDWPELERAGKLFVEATDGVTKVVTGPYPTSEGAAAALARVRELGFADAFTRSIASRKLVPVGVFETGIKKPLIPIDLTQAPAPPAPIAAPAEAATKPVVDSSSVAPDTVGSPTPDLPEIDVKTKRHSAAELQRVLKEKGFYEGSIDGLYGPGTAAAYAQAWDDMEELENYRVLARATTPATDAGPATWPEMQVLRVITEELAAGMQNADRDEEMATTRTTLLARSTPLDAAPASEARNWENATWTNLDEWATQDPLHARMLSALRVAYYQSQARLEAMYQQRGLGAIEARDLATAALRNLLAGDLDRFL